jgi:hypothetical protein
MKERLNLLLTAVLSLGLLVAFTPAFAATGSLDPSFGNGGKVETGFGNNARPAEAVVQPDGKLIVVGTFDNFQVATQVFGVVRYLANGKLDSAFGKKGFAQAFSLTSSILPVLWLCSGTAKS